MRAGRMRHRVSVLRKTIANDTDGGHVEAWSEICRRWAGVESLRGREYFEAGQARGEVDVRVVMRGDIEIRVADRIKHRTRLFDVQTVLDKSGIGRDLELMCKEYTA